MNKIYCTLLTILLSLTHFSLVAQTVYPDSVYGTQSYFNEIIKNYSDENAISFDLNATNISVKIPIRLHIIRNIDGIFGVDTQDAYTSVSTANTYFKKIGIEFFIDSINKIDDYNYSYITNNSNKTKLLTEFASKSSINLFLGDSINIGYRSYGFTYFPDMPDSNFIFLNKNFIRGNYLTTMLGHYMGLLSTHEKGRDSELASETNCSSSGDYICDTYSDPDLLGKVDDNCKYTGNDRDSEAKYYIPSVANIMSNSMDHCKCIFTPLQYRRMYYYYVNYRQKLSTNK